MAQSRSNSKHGKQCRPHSAVRIHLNRVKGSIAERDSHKKMTLAAIQRLVVLMKRHANTPGSLFSKPPGMSQSLPLLHGLVFADGTVGTGINTNCRS